jgi:hypothetical protein
MKFGPNNPFAGTERAGVCFLRKLTPKCTATLPRSHLFYGLYGQSPENGNFIEFGWRLFKILTEKTRKRRSQRLLLIEKARHWRAYCNRVRSNRDRRHCLAGDAVQIAPVSRKIPC